MKFGLRIDFDLRMRVMSSNTKPEVVWNRRGRHLDNVYDVIANRSRVSCAHKVTTVNFQWPSKVTQDHQKCQCSTECILPFLWPCVVLYR